MAIIGYMRISTAEQNNSLQKDALEKYGCDKIFEDKISGKTMRRNGLDGCLAELKAGDSLVVWKIDRLGRRLSHLSTLLDSLREMGVSFVSIRDHFDTSTVSGRGMLGMMCVFAQMEREMIGERVKAGLAMRRARGGKLGPPFKITGDMRQRIREMRDEGFSQNAIAVKFRISQPAVCCILQEGDRHDDRQTA